MSGYVKCGIRKKKEHLNIFILARTVLMHISFKGPPQLLNVKLTCHRVKPSCITWVRSLQRYQDVNVTVSQPMNEASVVRPGLNTHTPCHGWAATAAMHPLIRFSVKKNKKKTIGKHSSCRAESPHWVPKHLSKILQKPSTLPWVKKMNTNHLQYKQNWQVEWIGWMILSDCSTINN